VSINDDFHAFVQQRATELAGTKTAQQTAYERQQRLETEGGALFTGLFAQLDENNHEQEPAPADPAEADFNRTFGL
jgi:hypothetical protein